MNELQSTAAIRMTCDEFLVWHSNDDTTCLVPGAWCLVPDVFVSCGNRA